MEFKEDKAMKEVRQIRKEWKHTSYKGSNSLSLIKSVLENYKMVKEFRALLNKEK